MNTYYGNLEQFTDEHARWFAHAQSMWLPLTAHGQTHTFGPASTSPDPYGFVSSNPPGALYTSRAEKAPTRVTVNAYAVRY